MEAKEIAEQAWRNYCKKWIDCNPEGATLIAINDYKASLREAIEKKIHSLVLAKAAAREDGDMDGELDSKMLLRHYHTFLELIDTINPKN